MHKFYKVLFLMILSLSTYNLTADEQDLIKTEEIYQCDVISSEEANLCPCTSPNTGLVRPFQIAIFHPLQIFREDVAIYGVRLNLIYGCNREVRGLDVGLVNRVKGDMMGIQWGVVNFNEGDFYGYQRAFVNITKGSVRGIQDGLLNLSRNCYGLQIGFGNSATEELYGAQLALSNIAGDAQGLQLGIINVAEKINGLQIGLINYTQVLKGVQIGVINIHGCAPVVKFMPIMNVSW